MPPKKRKPEDGTEPKPKRGRPKKDAKNGSGDSAGVDTDKEIETYDYEADGGTSEVRIEGSKVSGVLLFSGGTNWDLIGRNNVPKGVKNGGGRNLWGPHTCSSLSGVRVRTVVSASTSCHSVAITTEGKALTWGRNDKGQLGQGDSDRRDVPTLIESLSDLNVVDAAVGKNHTLLLSDRGIVFGFGENKMGQCGLNSQTQSIPSPTKICYKGPPIRRMTCGAEFSMIVDIRGNLYSFGCPEYGQLGHNTDGKYFVSSNKLDFACELKPRKVQVFIEKARDGQILPVNDVEITDVASGSNHTIALDSKNRVFSWGFGGYGRLGHAEPRDEMVPRMIKYFDVTNRSGAKYIKAGTAYSMAISIHSQLFFWGQTKSGGEATMYPKAVADLNGWDVRDIGCSHRSIVVAADDSLVSWGPSPTYGELCYGDGRLKSSTRPEEVKCLGGVYIHKVACGYGHTLLIARDDSDEDKEAISKLPVFDPTSKVV